MSEENYNQMDALKYLVGVGPSWINEWTEAAMYSLLKKVIKDDDKKYSKKKLDELLTEVNDHY